MADNYLGRVALDGNAPAAPVSEQIIVDGKPVGPGNLLPAISTDSGVRRMQALTWEAGTAVSNTVGLDAHERISAILIPSAGWNASAVRILVDVSDDNATWYVAHGLDGTIIYATLTGTASLYGVTFTDEQRAQISRKYVRFRSCDGANAAVNQAGAVICQLGSVNATSPTPYSVWSFRVAAGGSINVDVTGAGRVTWQVCDGTGNVVTNAANLTLTAIAKTVDVQCTAAFGYVGSSISINSGTGVKFGLSAVPSTLSKFKMTGVSGTFTGALSSLNRNMSYLYLNNLTGSSFTGSFLDLPRNLNTVYLSLLTGSSFTGALIDLPRTLQYCTVANLTGTFTGALIDLPPAATTIAIYSLTGAVFTGSINDFSKTATSLYLANLTGCTFTGSLDDLAKTLTYLYLANLGSSVFTGSLGNLAKTIMTMIMFGLTNSTFTGNLATDLPPSISAVLRLYDLPATVAGAFATANIAAGCKDIKCYNAGFTPTDTDNMLINLNAVGSSTGVAVFETNRTAASDAALAALQGRSWTITFA